MRQRLTVLAVTAVMVLVLLALNTARNAVGWQPLVEPPEARAQMLAASWRLLTPPTPGPHKAAVLLSGCDGVHDNMEFWAQQMLAQNRAALILDSHTPRNLGVAQAWRAVCAGQVLTGAERAGDLAVALAELGKMPGIDTRDVAVLGASHGGWSVMELMAAFQRPDPPPGLAAWPAPRADLQAQIGPVVLLYPYCGLISGAGAAHWPAQAHGLMLLAQHDSIVDSAACRTMTAKLVAQGADLKAVTLPGVDHGFDQSERSALSPLKFDARARDRAAMLVADFMQGFASAPDAGI
ncbi:dienelactone hydrolase family protein [Paracoccus shanxieyensis]|uniref:Dienelactone hydrolase n=1 Tax=Paracoccus shanxieyensis TaxID=2675752 RepID=A0A6L6IRF0_9RHOB|nr:dienelactone hydrolase family protein [Paracoccus shanxieyensis]MTH62733.1 dienelactone hydrolase [Paracoccus shanxieyensis]MTH86183.1 dienelactone hydrolase [Paracoccus shanxieyensis]